MTVQEKTSLIKEPVAHVLIPQVQVAKEPVESAVKIPVPVPVAVVKETTHIPQITTADITPPLALSASLLSNINTPTDDTSVQRYCTLSTFR